MPFGNLFRLSTTTAPAPAPPKSGVGSAAVSSSSSSSSVSSPATPSSTASTATSHRGSDTDTLSAGRGEGEEEEDSALLTPATPASMHVAQDPTPSTPTSPLSPPSPPTTTTSTPKKDLYTPKYSSPPPTQHPYTPAIALSDIPAVTYALDLFLQSKMLESEAYLVQQDPKMERLYIATGFGLIQCVKGLMSYEDADLLAGITHTKQGNLIAAQHRKKAAFFGSRVAGYVVSSVSSVLQAPSSGGSGTSDSDNATASVSSSVQWIKSMTDVERHAELVYAESLFEKALLGIVYSGDWLAFIKEALNMRTTISIYRQLGAYLEHMDSLTSSPSSPSPSSSSPHTPNPAVDQDFRSGVLLGVGMSHIILSLMPGKLATLVELFGYKGDRAYGLECLMRAGGWVEGESGEPRIGASEEGVRRSICDLCLLIFHLVLSSFTSSTHTSTPLASRILGFNLTRFPSSVFFLFGAGRLALLKSKPREAIGFYEKAMRAQSQYGSLGNVSYWEIAVARLALWELREGAGCWRVLERDATWSKAIYSYGLAVCLIEISKTTTDEEERKDTLEEASQLMQKVPGLRQKIAGKSIPLEKFVARKARKFHAQNQRLLLPALELAYVFQGIAHAPRRVILERMLPEVRRALGEVGWGDEVGVGGGVVDALGGAGREKAVGGGEKGVGAEEIVGEEKVMGARRAHGGVRERRDRQEVERTYGEKRGGGYWDDFALAMFLRGVCMRYVAYPDPDAEVDPADVHPTTPGLVTISKEDAEKEAEASFRAVFEHGPKIELDHQLVYHAHYELGRLLACHGTPAHLLQAKTEFELVLSGKPLEVQSGKVKGKYSMENALHMRTHAALDVLDQMGRGKVEVGRRL